MDNLLSITSLNKHFNGVKALDDFSCSVGKGEIVGLIGPNGAGKSTLFNVITGFIEGDSGTVQWKSKNITGQAPHVVALSGIARTFQSLRLLRQMTVLENVLLAFPSQPGEKLANVFLRSKAVAAVEKKNRTRAMELLEFAGIADKSEGLANDLSYGQQKLLSIVCCLAADAELLLLDEPVAGLNPVMIDKIVAIITGLSERGKSVIVIEHNMDAITASCSRVIAMDEGRKICEGSFDEVKNDPRVIDSYLE